MANRISPNKSLTGATSGLKYQCQVSIELDNNFGTFSDIVITEVQGTKADNITWDVLAGWDNSKGGVVNISFTPNSIGVVTLKIDVFSQSDLSSPALTTTYSIKVNANGYVKELINHLDILYPVASEFYPDLIVDYVSLKELDICSALIDSDDIHGSDLKEHYSVNYPEEEGERVLVNPNRKSFVYSFELCFVGINYLTCNEYLQFLIDKILGKRVSITNKYKGIQVYGYVLKTPTITSREKHDDIDIVNYTIELLVDRPQDCNFVLNAEDSN